MFRSVLQYIRLAVTPSLQCLSIHGDRWVMRIMSPSSHNILSETPRTPRIPCWGKRQSRFIVTISAITFGDFNRPNYANLAMERLLFASFAERTSRNVCTHEERLVFRQSRPAARQNLSHGRRLLEFITCLRLLGACGWCTGHRLASLESMDQRLLFQSPWSWNANKNVVYKLSYNLN